MRDMRELFKRDLLNIINQHQHEENEKNLLEKYVDELFEKYRFHNYRYINLLHRELERIDNELNEINSKLSSCECRYSSPEADQTLKLITTPGGRREANESLTSWLRGARTLEIADPYFFAKGSYRDEMHLLETFTSILPESLRRIHIYHKPKPAKSIIEPFIHMLKSSDIKFKFFSTFKLHDRVWIKDGDEAKIVGTSFNGLGNKLAFILDLPNSDLLQFQEQLVVIRNHNNG